MFLSAVYLYGFLLAVCGILGIFANRQMPAAADIYGYI